jgi:hypothetical protein
MERKEHNYLYLAPEERVPFPRHKRRPGKQSNLRNPRTGNRAITTTVKRTFADGTVAYGMPGKERSHKRHYSYADTPAHRAAEALAERAERQAALMQKIANSTANAEHWSSRVR